MGRSFVLLVVVVACGGNRNSTVDAGPPPGWTCDPRAYGDGVVCNCMCGAPDPDCAPGVIVSGCVNDQVCSDTGTCTDCGNGHVDDGEQCDVALGATAECAPLGYQPGEVPCNTSCQWAYDECKPLATCGNGALDPPELCDGDKLMPGLDCTAYGRTSGHLACGASCQIDTSGCYTCGDGLVEGPEACDDHNTHAGDGCSATCGVEAGWQCSGHPSQCAPICGDGTIVGGETCDDGNSNDNDGCSASCHVEQDCTCSGSPSTCSCATVQTITTTTESIDTGSLALDGANQPHAIYYYGVDYIDSVTHFSMEHGHAIYAERPATTWTTSEIQTWDQTQTIMEPAFFLLAYDGGTLRALFHRIYDTAGTLAVATLTGTWQLAYDNPMYVYDAIRGGTDWHVLVAASSFADLHYRMGAPGAWTRDEPLSGVNSQYDMRLGYTATGDVYLASMSPASGHTSYNLKLSKRVDATTWATIYDVPTSGACVYPIMHQPLALAGGNIMAFEDGLSGTHRMLRAHRLVGASWVVEDVADLSWLSNTCSAGGASWSGLRMVTAADPQGNPHILYASQPLLNSLTFEDHYRDATGWHLRTFPLTHGAPLDMKIDAAGTTHILALAPSGTQGTLRIVYIRISASAWS